MITGHGLLTVVLNPSSYRTQVCLFSFSADGKLIEKLPLSGIRFYWRYDGYIRNPVGKLTGKLPFKHMPGRVVGADEVGLPPAVSVQFLLFLFLYRRETGKLAFIPGEDP